MEDNNDEFEGDHLSSATTFSQLLFGDDDVDVDHLHGYSSLWFNNSPAMLCFGDHQNDVGAGPLLISDYQNGAITPQKSVVTSCESSSASSSCTVNKSNNKKRSGSAKEVVGCTDSITAAAGGGRRQPKKTKPENQGSAGHAKRKEKMGERISALQQLVSPFGKTDTASVLHEAMGYIRFLHDQVQVLCSPYMEVGLSSSPHYHHHQSMNGDNKREDARGDLRSRGLCLIPVESTVHVASSNGADFWSPAMANNNSNVPSSTIRH